MSELQDVIATSSIRAFNQGIRFERERIIRILERTLDISKGTETLIEDALPHVILVIEGDEE
jgi:hypothetical protein